MAPPARIQLQLPIPYKREPRDDEQVRGYLDRGYRILAWQRLSDQEAVVTLEAPAPVPAPA